MIMVPYSVERRHRLYPVEVGPVMESVEFQLRHLVKEEEDLLTASILFRVFYRLKEHVKSRPSYPVHSTWSEIQAYMNGTVSDGEDES